MYRRALTLVTDGLIQGRPRGYDYTGGLFSASTGAVGGLSSASTGAVGYNSLYSTLQAWERGGALSLTPSYGIRAAGAGESYIWLQVDDTLIAEMDQFARRLRASNHRRLEVIYDRGTAIWHGPVMVIARRRREPVVVKPDDRIAAHMVHRHNNRVAVACLAYLVALLSPLLALAGISGQAYAAVAIACVVCMWRGHGRRPV